MIKKDEELDKKYILVKQLSNEKDEWISLAIAIDLADEIMRWILPNQDRWTSMLKHNSQNTGNLPSPLPMDIFHNQKQIIAPRTKRRQIDG